MQIYNRDKGFKLSYSPLLKVTAKNAIKRLRKSWIKNDFDPRTPQTRITARYAYDRYMDVLIGYSQLHYRFVILVRIRTRTNLNCSANLRKFYTTQRIRFRNTLYRIPLSFTKEFLYDESNFHKYSGYTVILYKKYFEVKLGFCGSHLESPNIYSHFNRW